MKPIEGAVEIEGRHRDETYYASQSGAAKNVVKESSLRGALLLNLEGDVYHPRLFTYRAKLDLGYQKIQQTSNQEDRRTTVANDFFDIRGQFFRENSYTASFYAFRNHVETQQTFFTTSDAIIFEGGGNIRAKDWVVPSTLAYRHSDYAGRVGDTRFEVRDTVDMKGVAQGDTVDFDYELEFNSIQANSVPEPYEDYRMSSNLSVKFGGDHQHVASVGGFYRQQAGYFSNQQSLLNGRLAMALDRSLDWISSANFDRTIYASSRDVPSKRIQWRTYLEHQLFDSLTSEVGVNGLDQYFGDSETLRNGGRVSLVYRKDTSFGQLNASLVPSGYIQDETGTPDRQLPVSDEPHRYSLGVPIFLNNLNVDPSTILVTDDRGLTIYNDPMDYTVRQGGPSTEIVIAVGSRILPGDTILVSYRFTVGSDKEFRSLSNQANLVLNFGDMAFLGLYWGITRTDLLSGTDDGTLDDVDELGANFSLRTQGHELKYDFLNRNSNFTPIRRHSIDGRMSFLPNLNLSIDTDAGIYHTYHKDTEVREWGVYAGGVSNWRLADQLRFLLSAQFRRIDYNSDQGRGWYVDSRLIYDLGQTMLALRVMGSQERWSIQNDSNRFRVMFTVRREF